MNYPANSDVVTAWFASIFKDKTLDILEVPTAPIKNVNSYKPVDIILSAGKSDIVMENIAGKVYHIKTKDKYMKWKQIVCGICIGLIIGITSTSLFFLFEDPYRNHAVLGYWKSSFGTIRFYQDGTGAYLGLKKIVWLPINDHIAKIEFDEDSSTWIVEFTVKESDDGLVGIAHIAGQKIVFTREQY